VGFDLYPYGVLVWFSIFYFWWIKTIWHFRLSYDKECKWNKNARCYHSGEGQSVNIHISCLAKTGFHFDIIKLLIWTVDNLLKMSEIKTDCVLCNTLNQLWQYLAIITSIVRLQVVYSKEEMTRISSDSIVSMCCMIRGAQWPCGQCASACYRGS
jgi:hypothetical protein